MALSEDVRKKYTPAIGIEAHIQLKTKTKLFSAVGNDARQAKPNTLISHIDTAMPGALPVLNEAAIELAVRAAFALNTTPQKHSYFERKHYFYPDSPAGYQISQLNSPIIIGGFVEIDTDGQKRSININRVQLEADAGKTTHPTGADYSLVDLNRAGTPLLEIVSEPDVHSATEAKAYARELYLLMKYADVSDVDLYHGNMRFDVNISVSNQPGKLGKRTEIKNLNSFRSVENAVTYEIERQIELYEKGQEVIQETRGWDEAKQKTTSQRTKEEAHDYRYMPEPDIPPLELTDDFIEEIKDNLPALPNQIRGQLNKLDIGPQVVEDILDNYQIYQRIFEAFSQSAVPENVRRIAYYLLEDPKRLSVSTDNLLKVAESVRVETSSSTTASQTLSVLVDDPYYKDVDELIKGNTQISDESEIEKIAAEVIKDNPKAAEDVRNGEIKAIGFLVGQVMAKSQGKANPEIAQKLIKAQLGL
jgi:aspartyl-tRNA(Asn)/glutamyl-tRNA(Gln) amidotransferase subunit B